MKLAAAATFCHWCHNYSCWCWWWWWWWWFCCNHHHNHHYSLLSALRRYMEQIYDTSANRRHI